MTDININLVPEGGGKNLDKLVEASKKIYENTQKSYDIFMKMGGKTNTSSMDKQIKAQQELLKLKKSEELLNKKLQQEEQKLALLKQKESITATNQAAKEGRAREQAINKANAAQKRAAGETRGWGDALGSYQMKFNALANIVSAGLMRMAAGMKDFAVNSFKAFAEQEKQDRKLLFSLRNNEFAYKRLKNAASEYQSKSIVGDEVIQSHMAALAAQGKSEVAIRKIIQASLDYSAASGDEFQPTVEKMTAAYGGKTKALAMLIPEIKNLTKEEKENGVAIDIITEKYKGFTEELTTTTSGKMQQLSNLWGDFKEKIGGVFAAFLDGTGIVGRLSKELDYINTAMDNKYIPAWQRFGSLFGVGVTEGLNNASKVQEITMKRLMLIAEKGSKEQQKIAKIKIQGLIRFDEKYLAIYTDIYNQIHSKEAQGTKSTATKTEAIDKNTKATDKNTESLKKNLTIQQQAEMDLGKQFNEQYAKKDQLLAKHIENIEIASEEEENIDKVLLEGKRYLADQEWEIQKDKAAVLKRQYEAGLIGAKQYAEELEKIAKEAIKKISSESIIMKLFGLDEDNANAVKDGLNQALSQYEGFIDQKIALADADVQNSTTRINELTNLLNAEVQLNQQGYASNIQLRLQQIQAEEDIRSKALVRERKAAMERKAIANIELIAATAVSVANIYKANSSTPYVGVILASIQVAAMIAGLAANKLQAEATMKLARGKVGIRRPKGIATGIDTIPALLTEGESVINQEATDRYHNTLEAINSNKPFKKVHANLMFDANKQGNGNRDILGIIAENTRHRNHKTITETSQYYIEQSGTTTRYIKKSA